MIPHITIQTTGVNRSGQYPFMYHAPTHCILIKQESEHARLGDCTTRSSDHTRGVSVGGFDNNLVRSLNALPEVYSFNIRILQIVVMEGVSQYTGINLVTILSEHIHLLLVIGSMTGNGFAIQSSLVTNTHFLKQ